MCAHPFYSVNIELHIIDMIKIDIFINKIMSTCNICHEQNKSMYYSRTIYTVIHYSTEITTIK